MDNIENNCFKATSINKSLLSLLCQKQKTMTTREKFESLKELELKTRSGKELEKIQLEFEKLAKEDPEGFEDAFIESARRTLRDARQLKIKEQLREVSQIVSMSYIAKTYFNKTRSWMSQRVNELEVNGKPAKFTPEEIEVLNTAFKDISRKISRFQVTG